MTSQLVLLKFLDTCSSCFGDTPPKSKQGKVLSPCQLRNKAPSFGALLLSLLVKKKKCACVCMCVCTHTHAKKSIS